MGGIKTDNRGPQAEQTLLLLAAPDALAALPDWLHYYTLAQMKEAGGNFLRWGHAAAGPAQIVAVPQIKIAFCNETAGFASPQ